MPKLYLISSDDILPFKKKELTKISGKEFLKKCTNKLFKTLEWGDAIQIDSKYRNENKLFWDGGWHYMFTDHIGPYFDYGVLDKRFSVIDKHLPLDYFNDTMYYNSNAIPYTPSLLSKQIIVNTKFKKNTGFQTYFMWRNKKIILNSDITNFLNLLIPVDFDGGGCFTHDEKMIDYSRFRVLEDNFEIPEFFKKYLLEIDIYGNIIDTKKYKFNKNDTFKLNTTDKSLYEILNDYVMIKINDNKFFKDFRLKFIDKVLNSKYLYFEGDKLEDDKTEYIFAYF